MYEYLGKSHAHLDISSFVGIILLKLGSQKNNRFLIVLSPNVSMISFLLAFFELATRLLVDDLVVKGRLITVPEL